MYHQLDVCAMSNPLTALQRSDKYLRWAWQAAAAQAADVDMCRTLEPVVLIRLDAILGIPSPAMIHMHIKTAQQPHNAVRVMVHASGAPCSWQCHLSPWG